MSEEAGFDIKTVIETGIPGMPDIIVNDAVEGDSVTTSFEVFRTRGQYIGTDQAYGGTISDRDLFFYSLREPVGYWWVVRIAEDLWDNWFRIIDVDKPDDKTLDRQAQQQLEKLFAKQKFPQETVFERRTGTAVTLLGYTGFSNENWETPLWEGDIPPENLSGRQLLQLTPYPWTQVDVQETESDETSLRYGLPKYYNITRGAQNLDQAAMNTSGVTTPSTVIRVHWTRVEHDAPRLDQHPYQGITALNPLFDDLVGGRNARWGTYQTIYRHGSGFPKITTTASKKQNEDWVNSGGVQDMMARSYFVCGPDEDITFVGAEGSALNPTAYYDMYFTFIAAATGVAKDTIKGVSAGRVTGSEVNERQYFKSISVQQHKKEPYLRGIIDRLIQTGQIDFAGDYVIEWIDPFEVNPQDKAAMAFMEERTLALKTYLTINEKRELAGLPPHPDGDILASLPGQVQAGGEESPNQNEPTSAETEPEETEENASTLLDRTLQEEL